MILTPRQTEVAKLLYEGMTPGQVARELDVSRHTVKVHMQQARVRIGRPGNPWPVLVRWYAERLFHVTLSSQN